eukprot:TRINITY_DN10838_c0_g1_i6.p1 TRINITY_DN10838_c0_g1~~TRINITY_DN10838_c0_g1_i6.p1  ORF type:complete len:219 (-),score=-22.13 TRINITY_DN10838_c0_g1_i6:115-696(-)
MQKRGCYSRESSGYKIFGVVHLETQQQKQFFCREVLFFKKMGIQLDRLLYVLVFISCFSGSIGVVFRIIFLCYLHLLYFFLQTNYQSRQHTLKSCILIFVSILCITCQYPLFHLQRILYIQYQLQQVINQLVYIILIVYISLNAIFKFSQVKLSTQEIIYYTFFLQTNYQSRQHTLKSCILLFVSILCFKSLF